MKILLLPRYDISGPSSRYRFFQYIPFLENSGWEVTVKPLLSRNYISFLFEKRSLPLREIIFGYFCRVSQLLRKNNYDIIWIEQEAFPWLLPLLEKVLIRSKTKLVADYDDAFFHRYDLHKNFLIRTMLGRKIDMVMNSADLVLAGNEYLAERAKTNNAKRIEIFPTVVDTDKFFNSGIKKDYSFTVGWIGSPSTARYLHLIEEALFQLYQKGNVRFVFIGAGNIKFDNFPITIIPWNEKTEIEEISKFDVGIMPLEDGPFERGKCGFKLIQYLSCEIPVVGSPVGVNDKIIQHGVNGYKAETTEDWIKYLTILKEESDLRKKMATEGRKLIIQDYSLENNSKRLIDLFNNITKS
ncbi:MAG: glycosyltransferase [Melioribacteraceae bacterium]